MRNLIRVTFLFAARACRPVTLHIPCRGYWCKKVYGRGQPVDSKVQHRTVERMKRARPRKTSTTAEWRFGLPLSLAVVLLMSACTGNTPAGNGRNPHTSGMSTAPAASSTSTTPNGPTGSGGSHQKNTADGSDPNPHRAPEVTNTPRSTTSRNIDTRADKGKEAWLTERNMLSDPTIEPATDPGRDVMVQFPQALLNPGRVEYGDNLPDGAVVDLIRKYFPQTQWGEAAAVAKCESGMANVRSAPNSNGSKDWGVFQLNDGGTLQGLLAQFGYDTTEFRRAMNADWNVKAAALLYSQRGWQPWVCARILKIYPPR